MLINLTPHPVRIRAFYTDIRDAMPLETDIVLPSSGVARLSTTSAPAEPVGYPDDSYGGPGHSIPVSQISHGAPTGLPEPTPGVHYVVSLPVLMALAGQRRDLLAPGTGPEDGAIRTPDGQIFAVTRLVSA